MKVGDKVKLWDGRLGSVVSVGDGHPMNVSVDVSTDPSRKYIIGCNLTEVEKL